LSTITSLAGLPGIPTSTLPWLREYCPRKNAIAGETIEKTDVSILANRNVLQLPFRRSHPVSLAEAIRQYISAKYDQRPDMFAEDLLIIDRLRTDAVNVREPHVSGISRLVTYAAQLKWIGGKFPIDVSFCAMEGGVQRMHIPLKICF
jgi:hypothetical protein